MCILPHVQFLKIFHVTQSFPPHNSSQIASSQQLETSSQNSSPATASPFPLAPIRQRREGLGRGQLRLQAVHDLVDVRGLIRFEQGNDSALVRAEWVVNRT